MRQEHMTYPKNGNHKAILSRWATTLPENDCSFAVKMRDAIEDRWDSGLGGKIAILAMTAFLAVALVVVVAVLGHFWPTVDRSY